MDFPCLHFTGMESYYDLVGIFGNYPAFHNFGELLKLYI